MRQNTRHGLIKRLQATLPRGAPFGLCELDQLGITPQLAAKYAMHGWLTRLGHGVYAFAGDELTLHPTVEFLQRRVKGLHIGGKSALALQGVRQNVSPRDALVLWGDVRFALPPWFTSRFPARYLYARLFDWPDKQLERTTLTTPPELRGELRVSTPERAALEMLYEVGTNQSLEEARNLFEGLQNVRTAVVGRLLECCTSVKAVRLFLTWSRETGVLNVDELRRRFHPQVGSDRRWISRLRDGTLLALKPYG